MFVAIGAFFLWAYPDEEPVHSKYFRNQGKIFGTYYNIMYSGKQDLHEDIIELLQGFDNSLSTFNVNSTISLINSNKSTETDEYFRRMYKKAEQVWQLSNGAFDITVAPMVNAWGFGFKNKENVTKQMIDSLLHYIGMEKISMLNDQLLKSSECIMLDGSAIAKGEACDVVAEWLTEAGCEDYLVEIGGEIVLHGRNASGEPWRVGITKPEDDIRGLRNDLQEVICSTDLAMATSGNYRQFYYDNGIRRSHTIDPRSGYPVEHSLLSATVIAEDCMTADALATACMVLGKDSALSMIENLDGCECYLIYSESDTLAVQMTKGMQKLVNSSK